MASLNNANISNKQYEQSQQAAPPMTFEAATAALDTSELLHLIIAEVPRENRTSLRSVSKNWQAAVLKLGHVIDLVEDGYDGYRQRPELPVYYLPEKSLKCNDTNLGIQCWTATVNFVCFDCACHCDGHTVMKVEIFFDPDKISGTPGSLEWENEFITDPPITQVYVEGTFLYRPESEFATLRVRGGIRVRDLRECFEEMMPSDQFHTRAVRFGILGQQSGDGSDDGSDSTGMSTWDVNDYIRAHIGDVSQRETGGGDTPYASQSEADSDSQGYGGEFDEGGLGGEEPEDGYEWNHRDRLEAYSNDSQGDGGESGEGGLANDEAGGEHEWSWEAELEKWSKDGQGDHGESREGD
jgi:hypothetical protein